ncbi:MAG: winged helix DNA-binding domain-containing protein [Gaiellaceae bacterium]
MRTLTEKELNRSLLARQLLLERSKGSLPQALERVGGIQAQYAPSSYVGLWARLEGFERPDLNRALEQRKAVQGTLMRVTIHLVSARDYPLFAAGTRASRAESWLRYHRGKITAAQVQKAATKARRALEDGPLPRAELTSVIPDTALWNGVSAVDDIVRVPPSGTWERRRADIYATADEWLEPSDATENEGVEHLLRRYLGGFGPARLADAANWAGVPPKLLKPVAERLELRRFADEEGKELLDLPRAPLPPADTSAPARFLPTWDATLLAHARGTQILPEQFRNLVFSTKTPHSLSTFLVDGRVAGAWRVERSRRKAELAIEPFEGVPRKAVDELKAEGERLVRFHEPDAETFAVRLAG